MYAFIGIEIPIKQERRPSVRLHICSIISGVQLILGQFHNGRHIALILGRHGTDKTAFPCFTAFYQHAVVPCLILQAPVVEEAVQ